MNLDNPYAPDSISGGTLEVQAPRTRQVPVLYGFIAWAVVVGLVNGFSWNPSPAVQIFLNIVFIVLLALWCYNDAHSFGLSIGKWTIIGLIIFFPIALVAHFFITRGNRGWWALLLAALFACLVIGIATIVMIATSLLVYGSWEPPDGSSL